MAMTGVLRPGHISLRVLDLEEGINFYKNTLGLVETGRDGQGRVYFKAWDEREHNSVLIREAESAGVDFFAFKVADRATLDKLDADLQAFGLKTERIPVAGSLIPHKSGVVKRRRRVGAGGAVNGTRAARVGPRCAGGRGSIRTTDRRTAARPA